MNSLRVRVLLLGLALNVGFGAPLLSAEENLPPSVLGQVLVQGARLDGVNVPPGTTLFSGSQLSTLDAATTVHLNSGQIVELGSHSSALFEKVESGEIRVRVAVGTLRFRGEDGNLRVAGPEDSVHFTQRRAGRPIYENQAGVVGALSQQAPKGQRQLVVNDASKVEPTGELVVKARGGHIQELVCSIESIRDQVVTVRGDLKFTFEPEDLLVQRRPVDQHGVYAVLRSKADDGDEELLVDDSKAINPLERIEIRHPNLPIREVACVRYTEGLPVPPASAGAATDVSPGSARGERIRLFRGLRNDFPPDSEIVQGVRTDSTEIRTSLSRPAEAGTKVLYVRDADQIDTLQQVMIRSADRSRFEAYCISAVDADRVILAEELDFDYAVDSEVLQGLAARALMSEGVSLQRSANCCCCCGGRAFLPFAWWWLIPPAVVPPAILIPPSEQPPIDCELFPTPTAPPECRTP